MCAVRVLGLLLMLLGGVGLSNDMTDAPTAEVVQATPSPSERLGEVVALMEGVTQVRVADVRQMGDRWLVYMEVDVDQGYNTRMMAVGLRLTAIGIVESDDMEFSVILWDGRNPAIDYVWNDRLKDFIETVLSIVPAS